MKSNVFAFCVLLTGAAHASVAAASDLPDIKISAHNTVPQCATPGRLMAFLRERNPALDARFDTIAAEYMRSGERLGVRWDYAMFQMVLETGGLTFMHGKKPGLVKAQQNNFAGLGATGPGEPGESFPDVATGVRAHLEHVLLYSGQHVDNPVAERTRKVQDWGVLTSWQQGFKRPISYADLGAKWAPGDKSYGRMIAAIAERFYQGACQKPDPQPELLAETRGQPSARLATLEPPPEADPPAERITGTELARRAIEDGKKNGNEQRSGLGAGNFASAALLPFRLLNSQISEPPAAQPQVSAAPAVEAPAATTAPVTKTAAVVPPAAVATVTPKAAATPPIAKPGLDKRADRAADKTADKAADKAKVELASAAGSAKALSAPAPEKSGKCRVWTASYGGQKAMIIRSLIDQVVNYTVLDVNEGTESREAEAFIAAYAKGGLVAGEYANQNQALDKAFELCPEG
jgi:hypothetical protein